MQASRRVLLQAAVAGLLTLSTTGVALAADTDEAVDVSIQDVAAKVGESAFVMVKIVPHAGFEIASNARNRISQLTANENGVEFGNKFVRGTLDGNALFFKVPVVPKRAGPTAINGIVRFAFVSESEGQRRLDIKTVPLMATVTGTQ